MAVVADVVVASPVFAEAIRSVGDVEVRLEQEASTESMGAMWVLWVVADPAAFETALEADPTVREYERLATEGDRHQYRVSLSRRGAEATVYPCWAEVGGVFMAGRRGPGEEAWQGRIRFPDRDAVGEFLECCRRRSGVEVELERLVDDELRAGPSYGLTDRQREVLRAALEAGYFEVPRENTLPELAARLGVSDSTVSESLRRGLGSLVRNTVGTDDDPLSGDRDRD